MTSGNIVDAESVEAFLNLFDGDSEKTIKFLEEYRSRTILKKSVKVPTTPVVIKFDGVNKNYKMGKQKVEALRGLSFEIHEGEFVAITGQSGSGKSTLLQLIGGLDQSTSGDVIVGGMNLRKLRDGKLAEYRSKTIGFVFQFFYLQPFLRLQQNLEVPGMFSRVSRKERQKRAEELALKTGLEERLKHYPKELSGGQMQRAVIARALMNSPKVLLADEPTGNLDSVNGAAIIDLFEAIRRELKTTVIVVTHDREIADRADRCIVMKDGMITT